jgi:hypothetical protein
MKSRKTKDDDAEARRAKHRPKRKKGGGVLLFLILGGLFVCLLSAGGIGAGAYFYFRGGDKKAVEKVSLSKRFEGRWQGTRPGTDRLKLHLLVEPDKIAFTAVNVVVHEGATMLYHYTTVKSTDKTLLIKQERVGSGQFHEWLITFKSPEEISVTSMTDNNIIGEFARLPENAPTEEQIHAKERARLVGKWHASTFMSLDLSDATFEFKNDGTAVFDVAYKKGRKTVNGTWRVLPQIYRNKLNVQIIGIELFDQMFIEFVSDNDIHFSRIHRGAGGIQLSARRVK